LDTDQEYLDRLDEELEIIKNKKFGPYFLVVQNMIGWAKKEGILGRPWPWIFCWLFSCATALGITDIDPIQAWSFVLSFY
jgi:DNA polymerase III subunit alpha